MEIINKIKEICDGTKLYREVPGEAEALAKEHGIIIKLPKDFKPATGYKN
jgi:hypothetical protein